MPVLAWIVAVVQHTPTEGQPSSLDFPITVARRALEWAEWLAQKADVCLLLNVTVPDGSPECQRLNALAPRLLNAPQSNRATAATLHEALKLAAKAPAVDTLLLLWIGHGVMNNRQRLVLLEDSRDSVDIRSWDIHSLLQRLRSGNSPALQIGVFDTCAQVLDIKPASEDLGGDGKAQRRQHFYFAATASSTASPNPGEDSLASIVLDGLKEIAWPPEPAPLHELVKERMAKLPSLPVALEWTAGSGDLWSRPDADANLYAEIQRAAVVAKLEVIFFHHLWKELQGGSRTPADLANALRAGSFDRLCEDAESHQLQQAALVRVQRVQFWVIPLARLHLGLAQWTELALQVGTEDGRRAPRFTELGELLLWVVDMGWGASSRGEQALLLLMVLAAKEATRSLPSSAAAVQYLHQCLAADATFQPWLAQVLASAKLPERPPVLLVELQSPQQGPGPVLGRNWLQRDDRVEPGPELELKGAAGLQLITLIEHVQHQINRPLRVELLAPTELLCGRREWVSYCFDEAEDAAAAIEIDTLVPVSWRWRDRLMQQNDARYAHTVWKQRADEAKQRANQRPHLSCRFDDDAPMTDEPPDLLGLVVRPPGPAETGPRRAVFLRALAQGHPYMIWPASEAVNVDKLKAGVLAWLKEQTLLNLPEGYLSARQYKRLPNLVLFLDEPDRNPYTQMSKLRPLGSAS